MDKIVSEYLPFILSTIGLIIWALRLENTSKNNKELIYDFKEELKTVENSVDQLRIKVELENEKMKDHNNKKIDNLNSALSEIKLSLVRIEVSMHKCIECSKPELYK